MRVSGNRTCSVGVAVSVAVMLAAPSVVLAQNSTTSHSTAPVTGMKPDRTTAPLGVHEAM